MKPATFKFALRDTGSSRDTAEYLGFYCGIHVLRGAMFFGMSNLVRTTGIFIHSFFFRSDDKPVPFTISEWSTFAETGPMLAINVLLLVGIAKRRASFLLPFIIIYSIYFLYWTASVAIGVIRFFDHRPTVASSAVKLAGCAAILVCFDGFSVAIAYRSYRNLRGVDTTVKPRHSESHLGAKIVGIIHLVLSYIAFKLCLILPWTVPQWIHTRPYSDLVASLAIAPICVIAVFLLIGLSKRRASLLLPFIFFGLISFVLLVVGTVVWAMFMNWDEEGRDVKVAKLVILAICACLEAWSTTIVCGSVCRLEGVKPDDESRQLVDSKPDAEPRNVKPEDTWVTVESLYPVL